MATAASPDVSGPQVCPRAGFVSTSSHRQQSAKGKEVAAEPPSAQPAEGRNEKSSPAGDDEPAHANEIGNGNGNANSNGYVVHNDEFVISKREARQMRHSVIRFAEQGWPFVYYTAQWGYGLVSRPMTRSSWHAANLG